MKWRLDSLAERDLRQRQLKVMVDSSAQTDDEWSFSPSFPRQPSPRTLFPHEPTAYVDDAGAMITPPRVSSGNKKSISPNGPAKTPSPTMQRMTDFLYQRLPTDGGVRTTPDSCREAQSLASRRPVRSVKKPVSYKVPSLNVKVRRGFQFFKFDTPQPTGAW